MANSGKSHSVVNIMVQDLFNDGIHFAGRVISNAPKVIKYVGEELFYGAITPFLYPTMREGIKRWDNKESEQYRAGAPFWFAGMGTSMVGLAYLATHNPRVLAVPVLTNTADFLYRRYRLTKEKMEKE